MRKKIILLFILNMLNILIISCVKNDEILIDGSSTVAPITSSIAEEFFKIDTQANIVVGISGTGGGMKKFVQGEVDIINSSRPMKPSEKEEAQKNNIDFIELVVALDGLAIVVNKENTWIDNITTEELQKLWVEGSKIKTWYDLNPKYPKEKITLYGPDSDSGTYDYFMEVILNEDEHIREDYSPSSDDNQLVQGVSGDKASIGFFGYAFYHENKEKLKVLKVNGVEPNIKTIETNNYKPLSRELYIYVKKEALLEKDYVYRFLTFYLTNGKKIIPITGYIPLTDYSKQLISIKNIKK